MSSKDSDFNDLASKKGLKAVKQKVTAAMDAKQGRPFGRYIVKDDGDYLLQTNKDDSTEEVFFCTRLEPLGIARTSGGSDYTLVLELTDLDRRTKTWLLPQTTIFRSGGEEARVEFVRQGGAFGPGIRERTGFADLLKSFVRHPRHLPRITLAERTGWISNAEQAAFVLPDRTVGTLGKEQVLLPNPGDGAPDYTPQGSVGDWRQSIGRYCSGNSRLLFACALCLAAPLAHLRGLGGGGFNLVGSSSCGKTTALHVAASVAGSPASLLKTCDNTANAFESTAGQHNDGALFLDELGQAHPEAIGQVIYKLAGGIGRGRADHHGNARERRQWRILFLTTGETDLASMMNSTGRRAFTGQELRLADIEADSGKGWGLFECLHDFDNPASLSDYLRHAASEHYGVVLNGYLARLVEEVSDPQRKADLLRWIAEVEQQFMAQAVPPAASGQVHRVAARFALVAAGGELGTKYGQTGWRVGEVLEATVACFNSWLDRRGTAGLGEVDQLLHQVGAFFERYGEARFQPMESKARGTPPPNRAGFRRSVQVGHTLDPEATAFEYFVLPSAFKEELCSGFDPRWAAKVLTDKGLLRPDSGGKSTSPHRLPGMGLTRCYHFPVTSDQEHETADSEGESIKSPF
jgi:uncharacterized protein (DUF927 family)